jgi:hypothetical protein
VFLEKIHEYNEVVITAAEILRVLPEFVKRYISLLYKYSVTIQILMSIVSSAHM